jgi:hypothetical protein
MAFEDKPIRRSALIGPWGVGAIVPFPNDESLMIAGLDAWRYNDASAFRIIDERLTKRLMTNELRWPPDYRERTTDQVNSMLSIPAVRFPTWHYCPFCGSMHKGTLYEKQPTCDAYPWARGRVCKPGAKRKRMVPERFVVVCPEGHIDDFPVAEWTHSKPGSPPYNPLTCKIRRSTGGASASLSGVFYECTCGAKRSITGATLPGALAKLGLSCSGARPWLGEQDSQSNKCGNENIRVLLRGATNVWFADTRSSICIPTSDTVYNQKIQAILREQYDFIVSRRVNDNWDLNAIDLIASMNGIQREDLLAAVVKRYGETDYGAMSEDEISEEEYRSEEYKALIKSSGNDNEDFHSIYCSIDKYSDVVRKYFAGVSLVPKLRETRAFVGFSRLEPTRNKISETKKTLRKGNGSWLPAIEVFGEGIFLHFNKKNVENWAAKPQVVERIKKLDLSYRNSFFREQDNGALRPEFVLLHTFAHVLINQLSFDCGYSSSSIRERIYCEKQDNKLGMLGILLYTASGDSEGSLGGLVRQGHCNRLEDLIIDAIHNASWCTSDPICVQSSGQGPESCNLAACHNCALLPETCCENGNRLLDRGLLIGTLNDCSIGYFSDILNR